MSKTIFVTVDFVENRKKQTREYEIIIVPNKFNVDYAEYLTKHKQVLRLSEELNNTKTLEELAVVEGKLEKLGLQSVLRMKYELIKTVMIANDHEFDLEWWDTRVEPNDIEKFIVACALKDHSEMDKKKELLKQLVS